MADYLDQLNDAQRRAVEYLDGPALVIAGAGSGKTRVLTYKIVHLLNNGIPPYRILALTFTNKAAREMRERIERLVDSKDAAKIWMGTFHSIFSRILRQNAELIGFKPDFTIYDSNDSRSLIKMIIKEMDLDDKIYKPASVQSVISMAKNALVSPEAYAQSDMAAIDRASRRGRITDIYRAYCTRCRIAGAMDFDDLLYYTNVLLRDHPKVLAHYREFFNYILIDEYQDTNLAQHAIVARLYDNTTNCVCMVGDDAQSIYSFRGANIGNILNLAKSFPNLVTFKLEQNYRSTQNIVDAANSLIEKNRNRIKKTVFSKNGVGERIDVVKCYSDYEESFIVANRIAQRKIESGDSYDDFAILYRTNAQSRILEESLRKRNIPYRIYGGLSFYQRREIKDAVAYFRLTVNPNDDEALRRIINVPARGIGETTLKKLSDAAIAAGCSIWEVLNREDFAGANINSGTRKKLDGFRELIQSFGDANATGANADEVAVRVIRDTKLLSSLISDRTPESISKQENLQELLNGIRGFVNDQVEEGSTEVTLSDFLARISLLTDQDEKESDEPKVTMMTVHAAKGLEFNNVFIVGLEEELFPSAMSSDSPEDIEEERRLLYVAITRARNFCTMTYASSRFRNGQTATCKQSRFISDIDRRFLRFNDGNDYQERPMFNPVQNYRDSFYGSSPKSSGRQQSSSSLSSSYTGSFKPVGSARPKAPSSSGSPFTGHTAAELTVGMTIEHERFGRGTIARIDSATTDHRIVVRFDSREEKTLMLKFAKFRIV